MRTDVQAYQTVKGSLADVAKLSGKTVAESFLDADCIVIVDTSGSMESEDAPGGKSRYSVACSELAALQSTLPGKVAVIAFSDSAVFCPHGTPPMMGESTDLAGALKFCKVADVDKIRFIVISDGQPNNPSAALAVARSYVNRIDTIYCGSEVSPHGRDFLTQLAKASGGQTVTADRVAALSSKVQLLLAA